jgi:hypothetical protein
MISQFISSIELTHKLLVRRPRALLPREQALLGIWFHATNKGTARLEVHRVHFFARLGHYCSSSLKNVVVPLPIEVLVLTQIQTLQPAYPVARIQGLSLTI